MSALTDLVARFRAMGFTKKAALKAAREAITNGKKTS